MLNDAQRFWDAIVGKVRRTAQDESKNALRLERYEVTTAANGTKMGVTLPMGTKEIFLPYSNEVASASVGTPVLVGWWGSMSNAKVYYFADGYRGGLDAHPIGCIYESTDPTSPAEIFGGSWERITGRFLLGTDTTETDPGIYPAGSTGGEAEHTLTADESGQKALTITGGGHSHSVKYRNDLNTATSGSNRRFGPYADASSGSQYSPVGTSSESHTHWVSASDAASAHNNMPPYLAVYIWKRVA